jgi:bifunctional UDP-N-acetylglucosamine pyrophosphorylase / glucosamine-1-phosphate N-acetyltransferase
VEVGTLENPPEVEVSEDVAAVVLAAGKGTRFRSQTAKVLHRAAGRSLLGHVLTALHGRGLGQVVVVVGHQADEVQAEAERYGLAGLSCVLQAEQLGTGHAVQQALPALADGIRRVMILPGDTPLLTGDTVGGLLAAAEGRAAALLTAELDDPTGYGRVVRTPTGDVERIVEHRDADERQRAIREVNAGMYVVDRDRLDEAVAGLDSDNDQGELYLTDIVEQLARGGEPVAGVTAPVDEIAGVNDRSQLADAARVLRRRHLQHLMADVGVTVVDPAATYVDVDVEVAVDATLLPGTILEAGTTVGERAVVGPDSHLTACRVGADATVHSTRGVEAEIGERATVGPFTHLRTGARLGASTKAGAYVEVKGSTIGEGSKIPHLAYVGDATVGEGVNLACGVVTVNYDGRDKHATVVADGAFVGCDTMLVAPVTVGEEAYVAAGSTITDDVPAGALAIARARQVNKEGWRADRRARTD